MRRSEARELRRIIEAAAQLLPDAEALKAAVLHPQWDAVAEYLIGQRVRYEDILYRCLQGHTAQAGWTPTAAPSLWAKVLIPDENVIPEWEQPGSANGYQKGDTVCHNGIIWISTVGDNIWEPGIYGWEEVKA